MSTLDVVAEILREVAPRALKARQIAALADGRLPTASRTPETVVSRDLAIDVRDRGTSSRFLRVDRGAFVLKEALPTAFYNDNDSYAAQWTRNLVAANQIAAGVVDERSIRDLKPADVASYRQCHFFSGLGVWSRALRDAGWPDDINVWSGSCPCQNFSSAGKREGFAGDLHLWPEWFRLISACRPAVIVGEQVSSKAGRAWLDLVLDDLEGAGYTCRAFDTPACGVGAPHRRQRHYFVAYARDRGDEIVGGSWLRARAFDAQNKLARAVDARDVAYARERGREVVGAPWLHGRGQPGDDALGRGQALCRGAGTLPDATGARPCSAQDARADRGDACSCSEAFERRAAGDLESERGGSDDGARTLPDAERVVRDAGGPPGAHGRPEVEPDRHGEADGAGRDDDRSIGMGDAGLARGGWDAGEVSGAQGAGEGEREQARDLADEPVAPGAADGGSYKPGDRIRIDGDPGWGGAVRGYWAQDVEWIYCRPEPGHQDGRWRPARAGVEPLSDGPAPGMGRTRAARLRGFGNAIVLPLATAFVEAVIEAFSDAARTSVTEGATDETVVEPPAQEQLPTLVDTVPLEESAA